jgi:hypothetical protein
MRRILINSAMIPHEGTWRYRLIDAGQAREWLQRPFESFVGYEQTASYLQQLAGVAVPMNRNKVEGLRPGDQALVCRLTYRVGQGTKGQLQDEDWEYGLLVMVST